MHPHSPPFTRQQTMKTAYAILILFLVFNLIPRLSLAAKTKPLPPLASPPLGERWFSINMNDERVGFAHLEIRKTDDGYSISSEGSAKMLVLGFSREASSHERYELNRDLSLKSFSVDQTIDKSTMNVKGVVNSRMVKISIETAKGKSEKSLKTKGVVYPPPAVNLIPLMQGFAPERKYRVQMLDPEEIKVKDIEITGVGIGTRNGIDTLHMQNNLYTFVDNDIWVDRNGNTVEESVRDGMIITRAEKSEDAQRFLREDAIAKRDMVLDFSLVKTDRPLKDLSSLKKLTIELTGYPPPAKLPEGAGQSAVRISPDRVRLTMSRPLHQTTSLPLTPEEKAAYLAATPRINSDDPDLIATGRDLLAKSGSPMESVEILAKWVATHLNDSVRDSQTAKESFRTREGNCQSHARLYLSLARGAGIPSRMVSGLCYMEGKGFMYHSWAESHFEGWVPIDPTFGQVPADIAHIRLVEGDEPSDLAPLSGFIGRIGAKVIEME